MKSIYNNIQTLFKNSFQKGFLHLFSANLLIQIVAFASQLFVAGILSPEDIGRIKIIQTFLSVFSIFAGLGFSSSTLKLCSENRDEEQKQHLFYAALAYTLISTVAVYLLVLLLNYFQIFSPDTLIKWLIPLGLFPLISNSVFMVFISYFQSRKAIKLISNLTISNKLISIFFIVVFSYLWGIKGYYYAFNISFIIMIFVAARVLAKQFDIKKVNIKPYLSIHWKYARPSFLSTLLAEISAFIDIILINFLIDDLYQIGMYSFALTLTVMLRIFPATVQQITIPYFSELSVNKANFLKAFRRYNKLLYLVVFGTLIAVLFIVPPVLKLIFAGKYDESVPFFLFLSIGWSIRQLVQLQGGAMFGLGKINYNAYTALISLVFNVALYPLFIYYWGVEGAAMASIPSSLLVLAVSYFFFRKAIKK